MQHKNNISKFRRLKVRNKIKNINDILRLSVHRSNKYIYAQIIDDKIGKTLVSASSIELNKKENKTDLANETGKLIAEKAKKANIQKVVFDRGSYRYHGRVKSLAESARSNGLKF